MTQTWTVDSLMGALQATDGFACTLSETAPDVLVATVEAEGDFPIHVSIGSGQILSAAILWPRDMQDDPEAFEAMMLRSHKVLLPLSALSVDSINGREYYELFGSIAQGSSLDDILTEITTLAQNALELARELGPKTSAGVAQ